MLPMAVPVKVAETYEKAIREHEQLMFVTKENEKHTAHLLPKEPEQNEASQ